MRKRLLASAFALAIVLSFAVAATAGETAFVDLDKALQLTSKGKDTQKKLAAMKDDMELQVRKKELDLRKAQEDLEAQKSVLSEDAFKTKVGEFQKGMMEYQQMASEFTQKFEEYRVKLIRTFIGDLQSVAVEIAKAKGYKIVLLKVEDVVTNSSLVLYGDPSADLTDEVVKKLNAGAKP